MRLPLRLSASGTMTSTYDAADNLDTVTLPAGGSVQYGWDHDGRRVRVTHRAAGKVYNVAYGYDAAGRPTTVTDWLNKTTTYGYDDAGRLASVASPNGVGSAYAYDTAGRLTGVTHAKSGTTLASVTYTLDNAGNRLTETTAGVPLAGTTTYGYDATDRLTSAAYPGGGSGGWGYDNVGNRTSVATNGTTTYAAYDAANRLCWDGGATAGVCATPTSGATTYTNDAAGNRTAKVAGGVTTTYAYDANNMLKAVATGGTTTATYTYDGDGYRTKKVVGATTTIYAWDRLGLGGLGTIVAAGTAEQVYGPAGLQQRTVGTASQYAHGDGLGSIRLITDGAGASAGTATYEPWGAPRSGSANLGGFGYTGELTDAETGFVYLRARYLDPATGRFLTEDSYGGSLGSPVSQQRFAYGNDNPTNLTDPSGQCPVCLVVPAGAAAAIVALLPFITAVGISMAIVYACAKTPECRQAIEALADLVRKGTAGCAAEIQQVLTTLFSRQSGPQRQPYIPGPNDSDLRGTGTPFDKALDEAFEKTGVQRGEFEVTKWAPGPYGKQIPVEWRGPGGAEVSIDIPHTQNGPDVPHIGWQAPGKPKSGGGQSGHIFVDEVPANRSPKKEE